MSVRKNFPPVVLLLCTVVAVAHADNLLLISVDTLRADRLSSYGYRGIRTSHMDGWSEEGVRFEKAYAEVPLTLPSHSTLLTGTFPFHHGVRDNVGFVLPAGQLTLAEILKRDGYTTAAFIGAYVLASRFGTKQGFDVFDEEFAVSEKGVSGSELRRPAQDVTSRFLQWLEANRTKKFFAFVHFYDPHAPYTVSYDEQVMKVDRSIGEIERALERWKLADQTHVFLVADHGESLGEHGESAHGFFIYDSTLHVPWIIRPAHTFSARRKTISEPVSLLDVLPTALQLLGLSVPRQVQGTSAVRAMLGRDVGVRAHYAESYLPHVQFGWSPLKSLRLGRYKLIDAPQPELYDLREDPYEKRNLYADRQTLASQYKVQLQELLAKYRRPEASQAQAVLDREASEKLASLGYIAISAPRLDEDQTAGIDPKDRIVVYEEYVQLLGALQQESLERLVERIARLRRRDPELRGLHAAEALAQERFGNLTKARETYLRALEENPENNLVRANLANVYLRLGQPAEAEKELQQVLSRDPGDYRARNNLALLYRSRGELDKALVELRKVVKSNSAYVPGWFNLGLVLAQARQWGEAEAAFRRAIELDSGNAPAHFHLARVLEALGRNEEAKKVMETVSKLDRRAPKP